MVENVEHRLQDTTLFTHDVLPVYGHPVYEHGAGVHKPGTQLLSSLKEVLVEMNGEIKELDVDTFLIASGKKTNLALRFDFEDIVPELLVTGN